MAEIEIEKKKPVWPWILLVLIILAIIYFLVFADDDTADSEENTTEEIQDPTAFEDESDETADWETEMRNDTLAYTGAGVTGYSSYIGDESQMGVDHEYTSTALLYLIDAVREKATDLGIDARDDIQNLRENAKEIRENPQNTNHAGTIKEVGKEIANFMGDMQQKNFPNLEQEITQVEEAVDKIDPDTETLQQKDAVKTFFQEAEDVLQKMKK